MSDTASPQRNHYNVIYADPPWTFATYSCKGKGRSAEAYYDCMSLADIKALPVADWAAADCALFLWITDPSLPRALEVIEAWGFTYTTVAFTLGQDDEGRCELSDRVRLLDPSQSRAISSGYSGSSATPIARCAATHSRSAPRAQPQTS
jgi:hypothetical protein